MAGIETLLQLGKRFVDTLDGQRGLAQYHLHRLVEAFPEDRGAQDVVARDHAVQCLDKRVHRRLVVETELHLQHVGITLGGCQVMVQNTGLQRRQAVDVLHIADAAGHALDDVVEGGLVEFHQRQHVRGNVGRGVGDQVGRDLHLLLPAHRRRQCRQGRLAEQHTHVGAEVDLAHAFDQLDRQQGMAAQLEEVVVTPYMVELEQVLPDRGNGCFNCPLRGFVAPTSQGIGVRCGECLAVKLAIGGQREFFQ